MDDEPPFRFPDPPRVRRAAHKTHRRPRVSLITVLGAILALVVVMLVLRHLHVI